MNSTDTPPPELEDRVVAALAERGWLRREHRPPTSPRRWAPLAAVLATAALAFWLGRASAPARPAAAPVAARFLLLLWEGPGFPHREGADAALVAEYSRWARQETAAGRLESGEKLGDASAIAGPAPARGDRVAGFFLVRAADLAAAAEVARRSPHVAHGGSVEVRPIVETP
ncbi:MAG: YciI family protein [Thermoanaerobaculia bacterium]